MRIFDETHPGLHHWATSRGWIESAYSMVRLTDDLEGGCSWSQLPMLS
jgi:hypothetical protein